MPGCLPSLPVWHLDTGTFESHPSSSPFCSFTFLAQLGPLFQAPHVQHSGEHTAGTQHGPLRICRAEVLPDVFPRCALRPGAETHPRRCSAVGTSSHAAAPVVPRGGPLEGEAGSWPHCLPREGVSTPRGGCADRGYLIKHWWKSSLHPQGQPRMSGLAGRSWCLPHMARPQRPCPGAPADPHTASAPHRNHWMTLADGSGAAR